MLLSSWAYENKCIPEIQSEFRKDSSCTDNIFVFSHAIHARLSKPLGKLYAAYIDFKQAFDSINHARLWKVNAGVSSGFINTVRSFYASATATISLPYANTNPIPVSNGVLQGDTLRPLLFSFFLRDLDEYLRALSHGAWHWHLA